VGLDLAEPAADEHEESLKAAVGQLGQRDFWPLAVQDSLTVKARYPRALIGLAPYLPPDRQPAVLARALAVATAVGETPTAPGR